MTNEEEGHIKNLSPEEQKELLKKLEGERGFRNLAEEYPPWQLDTEFTAREEKIELLRKLLDLPYPRKPPPKKSN